MLSNPFPTGLIAPSGPSAGLKTFLGQELTFLDPQMKDPYSLRWNFGIQHTLSPNTLLEILYIGNHAVHIPMQFTQLNGIPRQFLSTLPVRDTALNTALSATIANPFLNLYPGSTATTASVAQILAHFSRVPIGIHQRRVLGKRGDS